MSTTIMSINWNTLSFAANHINTSFISPTTCTVFLSNCMIIPAKGVGFPFILLHTERGIQFADAQEFNIHLCTLWLKILKEIKNGNVLDLDFPAILASLISSSN